MADVENKTSSKGNIIKIAIIVLLVAILLAGGTLGGYMVATKTMNNKKPNISEDQGFLNQKTFSLGDFLVNLKAADNVTPKYLKTNVSLGYADIKQNEKLEDELKKDKDIISDTVNSALRARKAEDYSNEAAIKKLKNEIKNKINPILLNGKIADVYLPQIIVQ